MTPEWTSPSTATVMENTAVNTVVLAVKAVDADEGRNSYVEYSLDQGGQGGQGSEQQPFVLGPVDGLLRVGAGLDRETVSRYALRVTARDRGYPPRSSTMTFVVSVLDENDNAPMFDPRHYSATIPENATIGLSVLQRNVGRRLPFLQSVSIGRKRGGFSVQVSATDVDAGLNGKIRYALASGDPGRDFTIAEDTGIIRVAKTLNYERRHQYLLTVQAEDSGQEVRYDSCTVSITVKDVNDNPPVFLDSPYVAWVMEDRGRGHPRASSQVVARVSAHDADSPPHNTLSYRLKEGDKSVFAVNDSTGDVYLLRSLDRETQASYILVIAAIDSG
ncbi:unnamed protein product, partial [Darwinula stevensoni]